MYTRVIFFVNSLAVSLTIEYPVYFYTYSRYNVESIKIQTPVNKYDQDMVDSRNSGHQIWQKWKLKILTDF